jgi:hypothetical protein
VVLVPVEFGISSRRLLEVGALHFIFSPFLLEAIDPIESLFL